MIDDLNAILIECAKVRNCYPLMHRTLHEFDWFVSAVMYGWTSLDDARWDGTGFLPGEIAQDKAAAREEQKTEYTAIHNRWHMVYNPDEDELIRLARAFLEYCHEQYDGDDGL